MLKEFTRGAQIVVEVIQTRVSQLAAFARLRRFDVTLDLETF